MKKSSYLILLFCLLTLFSCSKKVGPTNVEVADALRHYFPLVQGDELHFSYKLHNTGTEPFIITDIQPSCGCIAAEQEVEKVILPGKDLDLHFTFSTDKNIGYVRQTIRVYGNVKPKGFLALTFDVNIVVPTDNDVDYEELFHQKKKEETHNGLDEAVNGKASEKGYWTDEDKDSQHIPHTALTP